MFFDIQKIHLRQTMNYSKISFQKNFHNNKNMSFLSTKNTKESMKKYIKKKIPIPKLKFISIPSTYGIYIQKCKF